MPTARNWKPKAASRIGGSSFRASKVRWRDLVRGAVEIDTATLSDPVLVREDGAFLYTLPSVADDIDFAISHVIRGEDHVTNTAAQIEIFRGLGAGVPALRAFSAAGRRGRRGAVQAAGLAVAAAAARRRHRAAGARLLSRQDRHLRRRSSRACRWMRWRGNSISPRSAARRRISMPDELAALNAKLLHMLPYDAVRRRRMPDVAAKRSGRR